MLFMRIFRPNGCKICKMSITRHLDLTSAAALRAAAVKVRKLGRRGRCRLIPRAPLYAFRQPLTNSPQRQKAYGNHRLFLIYSNAATLPFLV